MPVRAESSFRGRIDWTFLAAAGGLVLMGTVALLSAASPMSYYAQIVQRHLIAIGLGVTVFLFGLGFNYQVFQDQAKAVYGLAVALLVGVLIVGSTQRGHTSWFDLGFVTFQPSELARIMLILVLAAFLDWRARRIGELGTVLQALLLAAPVMALILKQPDFSSTLTFMPILLGMLFCAGAGIGHLLALTGYGAVALAMPLVYTFCQVRFPHAAAGSLPHFIMATSRPGLAVVLVIAVLALGSFLAWRLAVVMRTHPRAVGFVAVPIILSAGLLSGMVVNRALKGYQRNRFVAFVAPSRDVRGASYHVRQSQIAVGSGGVLGKGLFSGTQSQLGFLPERHTDFIYSVVGEEMGFLGAVSVLGLYLLLIWRIVAAARLARDRYGFLVCCGLISMFGFELIVNVGMCLGLLPVAGIPLPLISYGGSSLVVTLWALGIVGNIYSRRYALL